MENQPKMKQPTRTQKIVFQKKSSAKHRSTMCKKHIFCITVADNVPNTVPSLQHVVSKSSQMLTSSSRLSSTLSLVAGGKSASNVSSEPSFTVVKKQSLSLL